MNQMVGWIDDVPCYMNATCLSGQKIGYSSAFFMVCRCCYTHSPIQLYMYLTYVGWILLAAFIKWINAAVENPNLWYHEMTTLIARCWRRAGGCLLVIILEDWSPPKWPLLQPLNSQKYVLLAKTNDFYLKQLLFTCMYIPLFLDSEWIIAVCNVGSLATYHTFCSSFWPPMCSWGATTSAQPSTVYSSSFHHCDLA